MTVDPVRPLDERRGAGVDGVGAQADEQSLVQRARAGDAAAAVELVRRHKDGVYMLALRLVADRELAADVAQEALVKAWRGLRTFRGDSLVSTWLHRITVNTAWTMRRRWHRVDTTSLEQLSDDVAGGGPDPEQAGIDAVTGIRIEAALRRLTPRLRAVIVLKDVYDWSHVEIAEYLGITVTAAKVRLHRARKLLRGILDEEGRV